MDQSELIAQFCAVTAADPSLAERYLAVSDNNLESAITLFLESGGASIESQSHDASNTNNNDSNNNNDDDDDDDYVRERIRPVTERLVEPESFYENVTTSSRARVGIFNQRSPDTFQSRNTFVDDEEEEAEDEIMRETVGTTNLTAHQSRLARLFRPPFDIISNVALEQAKSMAYEQKKWVMVNIQDNREFFCQQLNRDLWSNKNVKETINENFIFVQYSSDSSQGVEYLQYYTFKDYPHIAILDPRTGEQMKLWPAEVPKVENFLEETHEFLARFSLEPGHKNPIPKKSRNKTNVEHMTEEEQIEMALRNSLNRPEEQEEEEEEEDDDDLMIISDKEKKGPIVIDSDDDLYEGGNLTSEDIFASILPEKVDEPNGDTTTRIQIRFADGQRLIRRFDLTDKVRLIFAVIKQEVDQVKGHYFSLTTADRKSLINQLDDTIEGANLRNSVIMVELG